MARLSESLKLLATVGALATCGTRADTCTEDLESSAISYTVANVALLDVCFTVDTVALTVADYSCADDCTALYGSMLTAVPDCEVSTTGLNWYNAAVYLWSQCGGTTSTTASSSGSTGSTSDFSSADTTMAPATTEEAINTAETPATTEESTSAISAPADSEGSTNATEASGSADASASTTKSPATTAKPSSSSTGSASGNAASSVAVRTSVAAAAAVVAFAAL